MSDDMNQSNPPAAASAASDDNDSAGNTSNSLDVLLMAAAMVTSPNGGSNNAKQKPTVVPSTSDGIMPDTSSATLHEKPMSSSSSTPTVTPPFTIELVDDVPLATLPTIASSTAPPKMKGSNNARSGSSDGTRRNYVNNPFALPLKKRWTAAQKDSNHNSTSLVQHQQLQQCVELKNDSPTPIATTASLNRQDSKKKKYRKPQCSHPSCPNRVMNQGVCARHGARVRTCSMPNCTKYAQKGGVCIRHGAVKEYKRCLVSGCRSRPVGREGVCARHTGFDRKALGPVATSTTSAGQEQGQGEEERQDTHVVVRNEQRFQNQVREQPPNDSHAVLSTPTTTNLHAATNARSSKKKKCSIAQCTKQAKVGGLCMKHGGKVKYRFCNAANCNNVTQKGGYCKRHFNDLVAGGGGGVEKKRRLNSEATAACTSAAMGSGYRNE